MGHSILPIIGMAALAVVAPEAIGAMGIGGAGAAGAGVAAAGSAAAADAAFDTAMVGGTVGSGVSATSLAASSLPSLGTLGTYAQAAGAGMNAFGQYQSGQAQKAASKYNEQVSENNAQIARQNATWAGQEGEVNAAAKEMETASRMGTIRAAQGASGVDVNSGSSLDVRTSAAQLGELDAINIRANAARTAYGYQTQAQNQEGQANLDKFEASNASTAGDIGAGTSLLTGLGNAGLGYERYRTNGGLP